MAPLLMQELNRKVVLNIGCGAGSEALVLTAMGAQVMAMDITAPAARAAEYLIKNLDGNGIGIQADARFIPLPSDSVDFVYSSGVLHHSSNIPKSISEIHRVLKPGGKAYIMLYATWSILFMQQRLMFSKGESAWITGNRRNPITTTYSVPQCKHLFFQFNKIKIRKTGSALKHIAIIGKHMPRALEPLDRFLFSYLGPCINIVAEKG